jgi:Domain of unknown function (DUF4124)
MRTVLLLLLAFAAPAFANQTVWKWVDERGVTHYSDRPVPGATKVELSTGGATSQSSPAPAAPSSRPPPPAAPSGPPYHEFAISTPRDDDTFPNTNQVSVTLRMQPGLRNGHSISLYLDGKAVEGFPPSATSYTLRDVTRGMHTLVAVVADGRGTRLQHTALVTFMVRQASISQPPVGPTLRPTPPKPRPQPTPPRP